MFKRLARAGLIAGLLVILYVAVYGGWLTSQGWHFLFPADHGEKVGEFEGIAIYGNDGRDDRTEYGLEFECVEFVNRFYAVRLGHKNMTRTGNADNYFWNPGNKALVAYPNGGETPPQKYDILVFDGSPNDGDVGHVAVISEVTATTVTFVQQNAAVRTFYSLFVRDLWKSSLPLTEAAGRWTIPQGRNRLPVAGWSRPAPK